MAPNPVPEIQRCSLTTDVLQLLALGVQDSLHFDFMDKPKRSRFLNFQLQYYFFLTYQFNVSFLFLVD